MNEINHNKLTDTYNIFDTFTQNIIVKVADERERACIDEIKRWAKEKGYDDVFFMEEEKLKEVLKLGCAEYERLHKNE